MFGADTADLMHGGRFHTCSSSCLMAQRGPSLSSTRAVGHAAGAEAARRMVPAKYIVGPASCGNANDGAVVYYRRNDVDYAGYLPPLRSGEDREPPTLLTRPGDVAYAEGYVAGHEEFCRTWPRLRQVVVRGPYWRDGTWRARFQSHTLLHLDEVDGAATAALAKAPTERPPTDAECRRIDHALGELLCALRTIECGQPTES